MFAHLYKQEMIDNIYADMNNDVASRTYYSKETPTDDGKMD